MLEPVKLATISLLVLTGCGSNQLYRNLKDVTKEGTATLVSVREAVEQGADDTRELTEEVRAAVPDIREGVQEIRETATILQAIGAKFDTLLEDWLPYLAPVTILGALGFFATTGKTAYRWARKRREAK